MPSFDVEFEVFCAGCGAGLCGQSSGRRGRYGPGVDVEPCQKCLERQHHEGYQAGYEAANG